MIRAGQCYVLLLVSGIVAPQYESLAAEAKRQLSEAEARAVLVQTIERDSLYKAWTRIECLDVFTQSKSAGYFEFAIREKHDSGCPGDPSTAPVVDRFRVMRTTKKLLWYDVGKDGYVPYDPSKVVRKL